MIGATFHCGGGRRVDSGPSAVSLAGERAMRELEARPDSPRPVRVRSTPVNPAADDARMGAPTKVHFASSIAAAPWMRYVLGVLLLASLLGAGACGKLEMHSVYANGQLKVLRGESDWNGARVGLWVYYTIDGAVEYEVAVAGRTIEGTGVYEAGKRIRLPTEQELAEAQARTDAWMRQRTRR